MDATTLLTEDHDTVRELFKQIADLGRGLPAEKKALLDEVQHELEIHARLEEEVFYPAVRRVPDENAKELVSEALEQHDEVKMLLAELGQMAPNDPEIEDRITELQEIVELHADEEEEAIFPLARERLGAARLEEIGAELESLKESLAGVRAGH